MLDLNDFKACYHLSHSFLGCFKCDFARLHVSLY